MARTGGGRQDRGDGSGDGEMWKGLRYFGGVGMTLRKGQVGQPSVGQEQVRVGGSGKRRINGKLRGAGAEAGTMSSPPSVAERWFLHV